MESLVGTGFVRFPESEQPFTFRSGRNFSTIDYALVRGASVRRFQVARCVKVNRDFFLSSFLISIHLLINFIFHYPSIRGLFFFIFFLYTNIVILRTSNIADRSKPMQDFLFSFLHFVTRRGDDCCDDPFTFEVFIFCLFGCVHGVVSPTGNFVLSIGPSCSTWLFRP